MWVYVMYIYIKCSVKLPHNECVQLAKKYTHEGFHTEKLWPIFAIKNIVCNFAANFGDESYEILHRSLFIQFSLNGISTSLLQSCCYEFLEGTFYDKINFFR